jgi:hypothetical protein
MGLLYPSPKFLKKNEKEAYPRDFEVIVKPTVVRLQ